MKERPWASAPSSRHAILESGIKKKPKKVLKMPALAVMASAAPASTPTLTDLIPKIVTERQGHRERSIPPGTVPGYLERKDLHTRLSEKSSQYFTARDVSSNIMWRRIRLLSTSLLAVLSVLRARPFWS